MTGSTGSQPASSPSRPASFLVYSYTLARVVGIHSQSVPALVAALLAGMCIGFLPYNFYPATIFMGDTGAMLLGLLLAYVPLSSTAMLDPSVLIHYSHTTVNRYPTILPVLLPAAILVIPYADLLMAVVRRTRAGMSPFAADKNTCITGYSAWGIHTGRAC